MKTICSWRFFGVIVVGLIVDASSLRAQPVSEPPAADEELSTSTDEAAPIDSVPAPTGGVPAPTGGVPASTGGVPAPTGGVPAPASGMSITIITSNKPWEQGVSMENRNAARALFLEGNRLFRIPLFAKAAEKYVAALGYWKHPVIHLNLAIAQLNANQEVEARESLERSLQYGEEPLGAENFRGAQLQLTEVTRQLGWLRVTCRTVGAQVALDGVLLFIGPGTYEGWVKAKDHEITAKKPEYLSEAKRVTVVPGQSVNISLKLLTLDEATDASRRWAAWKPRAVTAIGGLIMAAGGVLHALAFRNFGAFDDQIAGLPCGNSSVGGVLSPGCPSNDSGLIASNVILRRARRQQEIAVGGYIVGGSFVAAGIVLLYLNRPQLVEVGTAKLGTKSVAIVPVISSEMLGMQVSVNH